MNYGKRFLNITGSTSNQLTEVMDYARLAKYDENGPETTATTTLLTPVPSCLVCQQKVV